MDPLPPITPQALAQALQDTFQQLCRDVADAVSRAPTGHVISHSEEPVRNLLGDFREAVYQAALQLLAMPRKRLFLLQDPHTGRRLESKGRDGHTVLTVNGRITLDRRCYSSPGTGSVTPMDALLDAAEATLTVGVRELACRLNRGSHNFDTAAANLARAAQVVMSGELLRQVVEAEGRVVLAAQRSGALAIPGRPPTAASRQRRRATARAAAAEIRPAVETPPAARTPPATRVYLGSDGVKGATGHRRGEASPPPEGQAEAAAPWPEASAAAQGQAGGRPTLQGVQDRHRLRRGQEHRHVSVTQGDHQVAGA